MNKIIKSIPIIFISGLLFWGSCTKKDETPAPQINSLPEYYFKGTFDGQSVYFTENKGWSNSCIGGGGIYHIKATDQYNYGDGPDTYWTKWSKTDVNEVDSILAFNFYKEKINVGADYIPTMRDHYDLWQSGLIIPKSNTSINMRDGWSISLQGNTGNGWDGWELKKDLEKPQGYIVILSKENVKIGNRTSVKVTGYISCTLYETNKSEKGKKLEGNFSQLVSNYYDSPTIWEY